MVLEVVEWAVRAEENHVPAVVLERRWDVEIGAKREGSGSSGTAHSRPVRVTLQRRAGGDSSRTGVYFAVFEAGLSEMIGCRSFVLSSMMGCFLSGSGGSSWLSWRRGCVSTSVMLVVGLCGSSPRMRTQYGGKEEGSLIPQFEDHLTARDRYPSESSRGAIVKTGSWRSGDNKRGVPVGTHSPLPLSIRKPVASGTAPRSNKNETSSSNPISAWG